MAHVDSRTGDVVLRVVYDGCPYAGKTTNLARLCDRITLVRRGPMSSPDSRGPRTEYFDWVEVTGGYLGGRRVRSQVVSVPGQPELLHRRRYLLDAADVVVFVIEATASGAAAAADSLAALRRIVGRLGEAGGAPVRVVIQANHQDRPDALAPDELRARLGLEPGDPVIAAQAVATIGVIETFTIAVQLAVARARALIDGGRLVSEASATADTLHAALRQHAVEAERAAEPALLPPPPEPLPPPPVDVPAGLVWPPVRGRATLAELAGCRLAPVTPRRRWAGPGVLEAAGDGWIAHVGPLLLDLDAVRLRLLALVQDQVRLGAAAPARRVIAAAEAPGGWRIWVVTAALPTLGELGAPAGDERAAALAQLRAAAPPALAALIGADTVGVEDGRLVVLAFAGEPDESGR
jgi:signal recognition particle receptor subunit beta